MLCDFCHKNEAVFFVEQVNSSGRRKMNMCMECAISRGISPNPQNIENSIGKLFSELAKNEIDKIEVDKKSCPVCNTKLSSIKLNGVFGCPECFTFFKDDILALMKTKGIEGSYTGSIPRRLVNVHSVLTDRVSIQAKLDKAVQEENYEKAAFYRDYLEVLDKESLDSKNDLSNSNGDMNE